VVGRSDRRADIDRDALARVIEEQSWSVSVGAFLDSWFEADFYPNPDVISAAASWNGCGARLVLVTNQEHRRAAYVAARLGELLPIDRMVYSAEIGYLKSEPEFFGVATRELTGGDDDRPIVFMDDTIANVEVARHAGWTAVHFEVGSWRERMKEALAAAVSGG
jgi:putative hydrolase of the HAD superfamily